MCCGSAGDRSYGLRETREAGGVDSGGARARCTRNIRCATSTSRSAQASSAEAGKVFSVHYTGWLLDGTKFDSSREKKPLSFEQGKRKVIPGWDAGFEGMRVGGKRRLFIPYQLAYGEKGRGKIPPKAELIFDVELMDVQDPPPAEATK